MPRKIPLLKKPEKRSAFSVLSSKQKLFVLAVVKRGATLSSAAVEAGYSSQNGQAYTQGSLLYRNAKIRAAIDEIFREQGAVAGEVANELTNIMRATFDDFLDVSQNRPVIDLDKAKKNGVLGAMKKITVKEYWDKGKGANVTETTIELHDKLSAANMLAKHLRMYENDTPQKDTATTGVLEVPAKPAPSADTESQWSNAANELEPKA
jgi:phage terminase small subunit